MQGRPIELEPKAFAVLIYLVERRERVVSKEEIFGAVWPDVAVTDNALTRVIAQLRRQLGDDAKAPKYIETVPTAGYRFIAAVQDSDTALPRPSGRRPRRAWLRPRPGLALLLVLAAVAFWRLSTPAQWLPAPRIEQVTNTSALDLQPVVFPGRQADRLLLQPLRAVPALCAFDLRAAATGSWLNSRKTPSSPPGVRTAAGSRS